MYACMICCFPLSHDFFQTTTCQCVLCKVIHSHMDGDVIKVPITALMCLGGNPKVGCSWLNNVTMLSIRCALFLSSGTAFQMTDCQFWKIGSRSLKGCCFQGGVVQRADRCDSKGLKDGLRTRDCSEFDIVTVSFGCW